MLFASGKRPDRAAIHAFTQTHHAVSLSLDPARDAPLQLVAADGGLPESGNLAPHAAGTLWVELLRDGLTYDLEGLSPGPACLPLPIEHRFDDAEISSDAALEAVSIAAGPHLAGSERSQPVVRAMLALASDLSQHFEDVAAIAWGPSLSLIGRRYFESVMAAWLEGGAFPALGLTAFAETPDGALQSQGLAFWTGQELRIERPLASDRVAATRLGIRLVNQLVITGGVAQSERIVAPDGTRLVLRPSRSGELVQVSRE